MDYLNYSYSDDEKKKLDEDILAKNKALEDLIANQKLEENQIKDDYDSLGSRANRFLQVFGAGLKGENASQVAQSLSDRLDKRLQGAQARYKDQRDSAYTQYKDLLARREALNKAEYDRSRDQYKDEYDRLRDQAKDQQWEKEFGLRTKTQADQNAIAREQLGLQTKTQADQNAIQQAQLDMLRAQNAAKEAQAQQDLLDAEKKQAEEKSQLESDLANLFDTYNAKSSGWTKPLGIFQTSGEEKSSARINDINLKAAKVKFGLEGKEAVDFIKNNPDLFLSDKDSGDVNEEKARILGLDPRRKYNGLRINGSKDVIKNGKKIRIYELDNGDGTTTMAQEEIK